MQEPKRAQPMSREDRRAAIMDAVVPLLIAHGRSVTTRQIAEAAGVAEGTIYAVFENKEELISACVHRYLDGANQAAPVRAIVPGASLGELIEQIIDLIRKRITEAFALLAVLRSTPGARPRDMRRRPQDDGLFTEAISEVLQPYADQLTMPPHRAAQVIRAAAFSLSHPMIVGDEPFSISEIRAFLLHGLTMDDSPAAPHTHSEASAAGEAPDRSPD